MIDELQKRTPETVRNVEGVCANILEEDTLLELHQPFHITVSTMCLHHIPDVPMLFQRLFAHLR